MQDLMFKERRSSDPIYVPYLELHALIGALSLANLSESSIEELTENKEKLERYRKALIVEFFGQEELFGQSGILTGIQDEEEGISSSYINPENPNLDTSLVDRDDSVGSLVASGVVKDSPANGFVKIGKQSLKQTEERIKKLTDLINKLALEIKRKTDFDNIFSILKNINKEYGFGTSGIYNNIEKHSLKNLIEVIFNNEIKGIIQENNINNFKDWVFKHDNYSISTISEEVFQLFVQILLASNSGLLDFEAEKIAKELLNLYGITVQEYDGSDPFKWPGDKIDNILNYGEDRIPPDDQDLPI